MTAHSMVQVITGESICASFTFTRFHLAPQCLCWTSRVVRSFVYCPRPLFRPHRWHMKRLQHRAVCKYWAHERGHLRFFFVIVIKLKGGVLAWLRWHEADLKGEVSVRWRWWCEDLPRWRARQGATSLAVRSLALGRRWCAARGLSTSCPLAGATWQVSDLVEHVWRREHAAGVLGLGGARRGWPTRAPPPLCVTSFEGQLCHVVVMQACGTSACVFDEKGGSNSCLPGSTIVVRYFAGTLFGNCAQGRDAQSGFRAHLVLDFDA